MRQFEIVLFGATGVTGANTAHYIAKNYPTLKWAIAGRNPSKLKDLLSKLPSAPDIVIADSSDPVSLEALTCQTKVVISTVGPFALYGEPLVAACVKTKTHYIDSTGETNFVMKIIQKYHEQASLDKTFVVPCCGFDCVPSDLGAFIAVYDFKKRGLTADAVHLAVMDASGGISGGTIASGMEMFESDPKERKMVMNPYCLVDDNEEKNKINPLFLKHNRVLNNWQSFYFMSVPNVRYVMRSASLLKYGPKFEYTEGMSNTFLISALFVNFGWMVLGSLLLLSPFRWMLKKLIPQGAGPKQGEIEKGYFKMKSIGTSNGENVIVDIVGISDPGYGETCKMIAESALCIVKDMDRLNDGKASNGVFPQYSGGVLTSASAFGFVLVDRLNAAGMTFALNSNVHKNE